MARPWIRNYRCSVIDGAQATPLLLAVNLRKTEAAAAALIAAGANPGHVGDGWSVLTEAAYQDSRPNEPTHFVEMLLAVGADPNPDGYPPLFNTVNQGWSSTDVFRRLVAAGADIAARAGWENETVLGRIAAISDASMVDVALEAGADIEARDRFGRTPLLAAASTPNAETFERLMERGADLHARDDDGSTVADLLDDTDEADEIRELLDGRRS